jgi:hypothetical protein
MSKEKPRKKVVVTTQQSASTQKSRTTASRTSGGRKAPGEMLFGAQNYILMGIAAVLIALGLLLMSGGAMPNPDVWDDSIIYSFRRTTLAPIVILAGLVVAIFGIFKKA